MPESGDWWNAGYLIIWGTNLPTTRTPDAHFMVEARYRGQKVVVVSPDYAEHTKFADDWLAAPPGTDGALAMAMGHVILREFYVERQVPYFTQYARRFTDLPLLVTLRERDDGVFVPGPGPLCAPIAGRSRRGRSSRPADACQEAARADRAIPRDEEPGGPEHDIARIGRVDVRSRQPCSARGGSPPDAPQVRAHRNHRAAPMSSGTALGARSRATAPPRQPAA